MRAAASNIRTSSKQTLSKPMSKPTCREALRGLLYPKKHGQANGRANGTALLLSSGRLSMATLIVVHVEESIATGRCAWEVTSLSRIGQRVISTSVSNCPSWFTRATLNLLDQKVTLRLDGI
jgi:hypothetical protein